MFVQQNLLFSFAFACFLLFLVFVIFFTLVHSWRFNRFSQCAAIQILFLKKFKKMTKKTFTKNMFIMQKASFSKAFCMFLICSL